VRTHRPKYRTRIADDPVVAALIDAALRPPRIADLLARRPHPSDRTFHDESERPALRPETKALGSCWIVAAAEPRHGLPLWPARDPNQK
jgi:hypothetical protein